ncbi:MAG: peptidylprolyl isomerase [Acidimicrobiales bacterium]
MTSLKLLGLALVAAVVLASCSSVSDTLAVSVNGEQVSEDTLQAELAAINSNEGYRKAVEEGLQQQGLQMTVAGDGKGTFDSTFVARVLSLKVYYQLLEQDLAGRKVAITTADLDDIRPQAVNAVGGDDVFNAFPQPYQDQLVRRQALTEKLRSTVGGEFAPERAKELYDSDPGQFTGVCVSHIFSSLQQRGPEGAKARIDDLKRQVNEGADFKVLAREQSDDTAAAAQDGSLGCGGPGRFLPDFERAAFALPVGQVSDPVETTVGFHLILVTERRPLSFEEVQPQVEQELQQRQIAAVSTFIDDLTCKAKVDVNPRHGNWVGGCDDPEQVGRVNPPEGPATTAPPAGAPGQAPAGPEPSR